jgi:3-methyladenine DNA glycosylase AlkC
MASDLKSFYNRNIVEQIARDLHRVHARFQRAPFIAACLNGLDGLELMARGWHIAEALRRFLPGDFPVAADILVRSLPAEDAPRNETGNSMDSFRYLPHVLFVSKYGLDHFEESMGAQYELTKRFTAEFSVRAFFEKHLAATHARFVEWARDGNVHVRRLVSEGSRPRLPWAARLRAFQEDPSPVLALLELLKDDSELYVRRSVANSLNDIAKDHPGVAVAVCRRWAAAGSAHRLWIVSHALRGLVKQGHPGALEILGFASKPKVRVDNAKLVPKTVKIGETLRFSFDLIGASAKTQTLLVDYAVHFVKANGTTAPKVFKLSSVTLPPKGTVSLRSSVSFRQLTTRKHYAGLHEVELSINGVRFPLGSIKLTSA